MKIGELVKISWLKTIYLNYRKLPLRQAYKLPILLYKRTHLRSIKGNIIINAKAKFGLVKIGREDVVACMGSHTGLLIDGTLQFNGKATIGCGSSLHISKTGRMELGDRFRVTGNAAFLCEKEITFGYFVGIAWNTFFMDSDRHSILDENGRKINEPAPIRVGSHIWIGFNVTLLKGTVIPDNCIVAAGALLSKPFDEENCIIGGSGASQKVIKRNISWEE